MFDKKKLKKLLSKIKNKLLFKNKIDLTEQKILTNLRQEDKLLLDKKIDEIEQKILNTLRAEYTVMPRFGFHQPLDYYMDTLPAKFEKPVKRDNEPLLIPSGEDRMGYSPDSTDDYLKWGLNDKNVIKMEIDKYCDKSKNFRIFDFGCSSGRVLRHFYDEHKNNNWELYGSDIQAKPIQWMREFFPKDFCIYSGTLIPKIPFPDNYFDVIYGFSVFTHIKYNWDMWLLELKRVIKPGGILIQTFHSEYAWEFYFKNKNLDWVKRNHSGLMLENEKMPYEYFYYGDISVSQVFWKKEIAKQYFGRYLDVKQIIEAPANGGFQDMIICKVD